MHFEELGVYFIRFFNHMLIGRLSVSENGNDNVEKALKVRYTLTLGKARCYSESYCLKP